MFGAEMKDEPSPFLADWFEQYVNRHRDADALLPAPLELKYRHSLRVANNARRIARGLELAPTEILLAFECGLAHDVGRFPQYQRYGSYRDATTVDHGELGCRILESEGLPAHFDTSDWDRMALAVTFHNRKATDIPEILCDGKSLLLKIIRDADKLDIMDLVLQSVARDGFSELPGMLPHIRQGRELTPGVMAEVLDTKAVAMSSLVTVTDFLVMLASWFYDLNYAPARALAASRNIIQRLEQELPDTDVVHNLFADIKARL